MQLVSGRGATSPTHCRSRTSRSNGVLRHTLGTAALFEWPRGLRLVQWAQLHQPSCVQALELVLASLDDLGLNRACSQARMAWLDSAINSPVVLDDSGTHVHLLGVVHDQPSNFFDVYELVNAVNPHSIALECPPSMAGSYLGSVQQLMPIVARLAANPMDHDHEARGILHRVDPDKTYMMRAALLKAQYDAELAAARAGSAIGSTDDVQLARAVGQALAGMTITGYPSMAEELACAGAAASRGIPLHGIDIEPCDMAPVMTCHGVVSLLQHLIGQQARNASSDTYATQHQAGDTTHGMCAGEAVAAVTLDTPTCIGTHDRICDDVVHQLCSQPAASLQHGLHALGLLDAGALRVVLGCNQNDLYHVQSGVLRVEDHGVYEQAIQAAAAGRHGDAIRMLLTALSPALQQALLRSIQGSAGLGGTRHQPVKLEALIEARLMEHRVDVGQLRDVQATVKHVLADGVLKGADDGAEGLASTGSGGGGDGAVQAPVKLQLQLYADRLRSMQHVALTPDDELQPYTAGSRLADHVLVLERDVHMAHRIQGIAHRELGIAHKAGESRGASDVDGLNMQGRRTVGKRMRGRRMVVVVGRSHVQGIRQLLSDRQVNCNEGLPEERSLKRDKRRSAEP